ncbi:hypothetical protein EYZ11_012874 [Aspergillus tanneri]|uniref:chitinase n=1 Tax=Aspergillus tanneri TaxID=1220188 RepID=A0A4S3IZ52_9EURO|nr:hypothetical protein EYZ11_012874 [Aspergillus tanneri]
MKLHEMDPYLDFGNLMAYDYSGSWDQIARHQANIYPSICDPNATQYDIDSAIKYYRSQGVAPEKLVLGMPLYARRFNNTLGLGRAFTHSGQTDAVPYKDLPVSGNNVYNLQQPVASYLYNITSGSLFSYDTPEIISMKARYIMQERLGGAMFWEASGDRKGPGSLVRNTVNGFDGISSLVQSENMLNYPASKYKNVKQQFRQAQECDLNYLDNATLTTMDITNSPSSLFILFISSFV